MTFLPNEAFFNIPLTIEHQYMEVINRNSSVADPIELVVNGLVEWVSQGIDQSNHCDFTKENLLKHLNQIGQKTTVIALKNNLHIFYQFIVKNKINAYLRSKICYELNDRITHCTPALSNAFVEAIMQLRIPSSFNECLYAFRVAVAQKHVASLLKVRIRGTFSEYQYRASEPHTKNQIYHSCDIVFATRLFNPHDIYQGLLPLEYINQELNKVKYYEFNFFFVLEGLIEQFKSFFASLAHDATYGYFGNALDTIEQSMISIFANNHPLVADYQRWQIALQKIEEELSQLNENIQREKVLCLEDSESLKKILIQYKKSDYSTKLTKPHEVCHEELLDSFLELIWQESQNDKSFRIVEPFEIADQCLIGFSTLISFYIKFKQTKAIYDRCFNTYEKHKEIFRSKLFICERSQDENPLLDVIYRDVNWSWISSMLIKELLDGAYFEIHSHQKNQLKNYFINIDMDPQTRLDTFAEIIQYLPFQDYQSVFLKISLEQFSYSFCYWIYWQVLVQKLKDKPILVCQLADFFIKQKASITQFRAILPLLLNAFPNSQKRQFLKNLAELVKDTNDFHILKLYIDDDLAFPIVIRLVKNEHDFLYFKAYLNDKDAKQLLLYCINASVFPMSFSFLVRNLGLFSKNQEHWDTRVYYVTLATFVKTYEHLEYILKQDILMQNQLFLKSLVKEMINLDMSKLLDNIQPSEFKNELQILLKFNKASDFDGFESIFKDNFGDYIKFYQQDFLNDTAKSFLDLIDETIINFKQLIQENQFETFKFLIDKGCLKSKSKAFELLVNYYRVKNSDAYGASLIILRSLNFRDEQIHDLHHEYLEFSNRSNYQYFDIAYLLYYIGERTNSNFYHIFSHDVGVAKNIQGFLDSCHFDYHVLQLINKTLHLKKTLNESNHFFLDEINAQKSVIALDALITGLYQQKVLLFETSDITGFKNNCQQLIQDAMPILNCQRNKFSSLIEPIIKLIRAILKAFGIEKPATKTSEMVISFSSRMMQM